MRYHVLPCRCRYDNILLIVNYVCRLSFYAINVIIIIISLLMSPLLPYGFHIRRTGHNPPRGPSAGWWVLTTADAAGTNGLTSLRKHGGARENKFLATHPMTDQRCLSSAIPRSNLSYLKYRTHSHYVQSCHISNV
jgi:hypothetical protein